MNYNEAKRVVNALWRVREIIKSMPYEERYKFYYAFMDSQNAQEFTDIFGIHKMHFYPRLGEVLVTSSKHTAKDGHILSAIPVWMEHDLEEVVELLQEILKALRKR